MSPAILSGARAVAVFVVTVVLAGCDREPAELAELGLRAETRPEIQISVVDGGVEIVGLARAGEDLEIWQRLRTLDEGQLAGVLKVHVVVGEVHREEAAESMPAIAGSVTVNNDRLRFQPRFPLRAGVDYLAVVNLTELGVVPKSRFRFRIPDRQKPPSSTVEGVDPAVDQLPQNLLRFYVRFSAPMAQGDSYQHVRLMDHLGEPVPDVFLELGEELWSGDGKRLTLLLDPGRIKSGLVPKRELGAALKRDFDFELVIDADWPDANGQVLVDGFSHRFSVGPPDYRSPAPREWELSIPATGTRNPLVAEFGEALDSALLRRLLWVRRDGEADDRLEGTVSVLRAGTAWQFTPVDPWRAGDYQLLVDVTLEDLAGNRVDRLFEREVGEESAGEEKTEVEVAFSISEGLGAR